MKTAKNQILKLVETAVLAALGVVFMFLIRFSILPSASFLEYDMGDVPIALAAMLLGPAPGFISLILVSAVQALTVSAASSWQGFVMHVFASGAYILILYFMTRKKPSAKKLILALFIGTIVTTVLMIPLNLIFTPMYLNVPVNAVAQMLLPAIIPFNLIKNVITSLIIFLLYKPITSILNKSHLLPTE